MSCAHLLAYSFSSVSNSSAIWHVAICNNEQKSRKTKKVKIKIIAEKDKYKKNRGGLLV